MRPAVAFIANAPGSAHITLRAHQRHQSDDEMQRDVEACASSQVESGVPPNKKRPIWWRWLPIALIVIAMIIAYLFGAHRYLSLETVVREHEDLGAFVERHLMSTVLLYFAVYVGAVALSVPGAAVLTVVGGFLFGWAWGGIAAIAAASVGASIIFLIARGPLGGTLRERAGPIAARLAAGFQEDAWSYLLFLRLAFVVPFWLVNIAAALFEVRFLTFVTATVIGIIPGTFAYAFLGAGLDTTIAAHERANPGCAAEGTCEIHLSALANPTMIAAIAVLAVAALIPVVVRRVRRRRANAG
jgi:uncharacterized membrane protein YdjX (TVP38/TMEM64 family)